MIVQAEHIIQRHAKLWAREAISVPYKFLAHDRSAARGKFTHAREKARGMEANTPDTQLLVGGFPDIWCEFKRPGKRPTPDQFAMGAELKALGRLWFWTDNVLGYWDGLREFGIPLRPNAEFLAEHHAASSIGAIEAAMLKAGKLPARFHAEGLKPSKPRAARPTKAGLRFAAARIQP